MLGWAAATQSHALQGARARGKSVSLFFLIVGLLLPWAAASNHPALTAPLTDAERQQMVQDFVDFAKFTTESADSSPEDKVPSTEGQREFSKMLSQRLPWPRVEVGLNFGT